MNVDQEFPESHMPSSRRNVGRLRFDRDEEVINEIENDSTTSVCAIEIATGIPKSSRNAIQASLISLLLSTTSHILPCVAVRHRKDPQFLDKILWSDE